MDLQQINRIKLTNNPGKIVELASELNDYGLLSLIFSGEDLRFWKGKFEAYGITPQFNFPLWKKLLECSAEFNYLKISKNTL